MTIVNSKTHTGPGRRILFACYDFRIGGHSSYTLNFARAWRRRGHYVGVLVPEPFGELESDFQQSVDHLEFVRRGLETRSGYVRRLVKRITAFAPDCIINNAVPTVQATFPFLADNTLRVSVIHTPFDLELQVGIANAAWLDMAVAVSDSVREKLDICAPAGLQLRTIPVGVEMPTNPAPKAQAGNPLRLIYVGRLAAQKNLSALIQVVSNLKRNATPFQMAIVGDGEELPSLRSAVECLKLGEQVRFLGSRRPAEIHRLLQEHDFFLLTSHFEGTPHAVLEAMAHGLVVLASRLPGSTDRIIKDGVDGFLCDYGKPEEYARTMLRLAEQPAEFAAVSAAAHQTALRRYSTDALVTQYENLFNDVDGGEARTMKKDIRQRIVVSGELRWNFPGFLFQCKHRLGDAWRYMASSRSTL